VSLTDALDALRNAVQLEATLRQAVSVEWATSGNSNGPMRQAHDMSIANSVAAARRLVELAGTTP
jgi:hypothetical protein